MIKNFFNSVVEFLKTKNKIRTIFWTYFFIIFTSALLLFSPFTFLANQSVKFIDSFFVASSAFSDTGLTPQSIALTWNVWGQIIILALITVGGFGFFAIKIYILQFIFQRKTNFYANHIASKERGGISIGSTKKTIEISLTVLIILVFLFTFINFFIFYYDQGSFSDQKSELPYSRYEKTIFDPHLKPWKSLWYSFFHTISAINNAGFDVFGRKSLEPFYFNLPLQISTIFLFFLGGVGYPVIYDFYLKIINFRKKPHALSLFTKISLSTYFFTSLIGFLIILNFEFLDNNPNSFFNLPEYGSDSYKVFAIFFNSLSTRSAGFTTINFDFLSERSIICFAILMFLGAGPFSTAGGIRTTTFALVLFAIVAKIKGKKEIVIFKRQINNQTISWANSTFIFSIFLIFGCTFLASFFAKLNINNFDLHYPFFKVFFEMASAFGTSGISLGVTTSFYWPGKLLLIFIMFIGQLGISSTLLIIKPHKIQPIKYPIEDVPIV